jgi:hypothetical protein
MAANGYCRCAKRGQNERRTEYEDTTYSLDRLGLLVAAEVVLYVMHVYSVLI